MRYDPAMSRYLRERLKTTDLSNGIILDGYPATLGRKGGKATAQKLTAEQRKASARKAARARSAKPR